jgi:ATP-dependent DNA helicase DinG
MDRAVAQPAVFLAVSEQRRAVRIVAWRPDRGVRRAFEVGRGEREWGAAAEFFALCGDVGAAAFGAEILTDLFRSPRLAAHARRMLARLLDVQQLALLAWPAAPSHTLDDLTEWLGIDAADEGEAVEALCEAAGQVLRALDPAVLGDLRQRLDIEGWPLARLLAEWAARRPVSLDGPPYRRALPRVEEKRELQRSLGAERLDPGQSARDLRPEGIVAATHPAYEHREGQVEMARAVAQALGDSEFLVVEAGTGTGKSLAYLLPAVRWSLANGKRVVVSTNTKSLQDQLVRQDIPLIQKALGEPFRAAALKGRANYVCLRKAFARAEDARGSMFVEERLEAAFMLRWLMDSASGEVAEISADARTALDGLDRLIGEVRSDGDSCLGRLCGWHGNCAVERARRRAENAHVVVANHALLLADTGSQVMPEYEHVVIDEAHNFEDVATDQFGAEASRRTLGALLRDVLGGDDHGGLLRMVAARLQRARPNEAAQSVLGKIAACEACAKALAADLDAMADAVVDFVQGRRAQRQRDFARDAIRLTDAVRESVEWQNVHAASADVIKAASGLTSGIAQVVEGLEELAPDSVVDLDGLRRDVEALMLRCQEQSGTLTAVVSGLAPSQVSWVECEGSRHGPTWALRSAPVTVAEALQEHLYSHKAALVLTSATLTVDRRFDYLRQRLGLDAEAHRLVELQVPSPFDFRAQLLLCVPTDMPLPSEHAYREGMWASILQIAEAARGGTLVLFTARTTMAEAYDQLLQHMKAADLELLCQDVSGSRGELLDRLKRDRGTVLFGLKSFWEGVDVPGEALRCVIITKLPFGVPDDPVIEARREHLEGIGIDSQNEYYIPQAIVGFRQGFGRLIRTRSDHGAVVVLDRRLLVRRYGQRFLGSLEGYTLLREPLEGCLRGVEEWLGRG